MAKRKSTNGKVPSNAIAAHKADGTGKRQREATAVWSHEPQENTRLLAAVQCLRSDFDVFVQQTAKGLETSGQEIRRLARRLRQLEQLVRPSTHVLTYPPSPSKSLFTFLGRSNLTSLS